MDNLKKLQTLLELVDTKSNADQMVRAFQMVLDVAVQMRQGNEKEWILIHSAFSMLSEKLKSDNATEVNDAKQALKSSIESALKKLEATMSAIDARVATLKDGDPGKDADETAIIASVLSQIPKDEPETATDTRDKLETLQGDERLDKSAVKGIDQIEKDISEIRLRPTGKGGGAKGFMLFVGGTKKAFTAQSLNLTAGSGVTLAYSYAQGRNDVTITASGSFIGSQEKSTTTPNGTTATFAFTHTPGVIFWNGALQTLTDDYTVSGKNITFTAAAGVPVTNDKICNLYA